MTITRDGEVIAFYLENEVVCPRCVTEVERAESTPQESLAAEELEGAVEQLWCDRCDAGLISPDAPEAAREEEACCP
jgi:hypothetical protein